MFEFIESNQIKLEPIFEEEIITRDIVSFLNSQGGIIYIGVKTNQEVVGIYNINETFSTLSDIISNKIEPVPTNLIKSNIIAREGKSLIEITIFKGFHSLYCIKKYGFSQSGCPIRIGTTCKELSLEDIKLRYQKRFETSNDYMLEIRAYYGDISFSTMQIELLNKGYHVNPLSFEENYHLKNKDGEYNLLAELLSDHNNTHLIFVKFKGKTKSSISERSNYGRTSLISSYRQIRDRLIAENICISNTTVRPRRDLYLYNLDAVNEAIINALVHNDWNINEPLISMFDDRIEILSHGGLPFNQTKEKFMRGISLPRNRALMRIFQDLEITESTGHGTLKIIETYGESVFEITDSYINVVIPFNKEVLKHRNNNNLALNLTDLVLEDSYNYDLSEQENKILIELMKNPKITQDELSSRLEMGRRSVVRYMNSLQEKEYIVRVGSKRDGYWKVIR